MVPSLSRTDIKELIKDSSSYKNIPISIVNNHVVRLSIMTEPFYWHYHPNSDETFFVIGGRLLVDLEDRSIELMPGQLFTVPANVRHCTRPIGDRSVNLTFELTEMQTVKC